MTTSLDSAEVAMEDVKPSSHQLQEHQEQHELQQQQQQQPHEQQQQQQPHEQQQQQQHHEQQHLQQLEDDNNNSNNNTNASTNISINNNINDTIISSGSSNSSSNRMMKIKKLRAKLVNEEHRLVLMKKIRQSQTRPISAQQQQQPTGASGVSSGTATNVVNNLSTHGGGVNNNNLSFSAGAGHLKKPIRQSQLSSSSLTNSALPLQKNNYQSLSLHALNNTSNNNSNNNSSNQTPAHAHQRPKVNTLWNPPQQGRHPTPAGIAPPHVGNMSRQPITTPPNVVQAMMGSLTGPQSLLMNSIANAQTTSRRGQQQPQQQSSVSNKMQSSSQMLMQKRPSFKPSLQKQLEQTLLQQQQQQQLQQREQQSKYVQGLNFSSNLSNKRGVSGITSPHVGNLSRQPITTPPNVVQDMRANLSTGQQSLLMNANNLSSPASNLSARQPQSQQGSQQQSSSPFNKSQATQLLFQRRNAAKTAIQKQLEQNLMQLPQKQIQLAIDFIPNANNIEFVYYIGLEACVDYLTNTKNPLDIEPLKKPLECSTCGTDFTPSWSWKRSNNAVCENCVSNHVKKSIKNSQANRIKSALAKAVKQESEMDQRIMAEAASVVSSPGSPATSSSHQQHSLLQPTSQHQRQTPQRNSSLNSNNNSNNWPRVNQSPLSTSSANNNIRTSASNVQPVVPPNPLGALQPAALLSLLQMNPQLNALASLINPTTPVTTTPAQTPSAATPLNNSTNSNNTNQFAQVAALLMNQLTTNLWRR